ncbi:MAG: hypothetical protein ACUVWP_01275 [bacterium]
MQVSDLPPTRHFSRDTINWNNKVAVQIDMKEYNPAYKYIFLLLSLFSFTDITSSDKGISTYFSNISDSRYSPVNTNATSVLLVSDQTDGVDNPQFFDAYYIQALNSHNVAYSFWDHDRFGSPKLTDLEPYKLIIWFTGNSGQYSSDTPNFGHVTLTKDEEKTLCDYLNTLSGDRSVILSGMWIAWNCVANASNNSQEFSILFSGLLGLDYPVDNFTGWITVNDDWEVKGVKESPIFKGAIYGVEWKSNMNNPDMLESNVNGGDARWFDGSQFHHHSCIHNEGDKMIGGKFRIALLSCPFESIGSNDDRKKLMGNILNWCKVPSISIENTSIGQIKSLFH